MKDFALTCSTPCDMSLDFLLQHKMYFVGFFYYLDDEKTMDDFFTTHSVKEFYAKIKTCAVKTSQPDPEQYEKLWSKLIKQSNDILHIELASGLSGAVNSALIAKSIVEEKHPDAKIRIVDSQTGSCGIGLLLKKVYDFKNDNHSIEETFEYAEKIKYNVNVIFIVENLDQLIKGGRLSKVAGGIGKVLNIVPILHVTNDGKLETIKKSRGLNNAIEDLINIMNKNINENDEIFISNSNCYDNAVRLCYSIKERFPNAILTDDNISNIGALIGCHTGEKCLVVAYIGNGRV